MGELLYSSDDIKRMVKRLCGNFGFYMIDDILYFRPSDGICVRFDTSSVVFYSGDVLVQFSYDEINSNISSYEKNSSSGYSIRTFMNIALDYFK